MNKPVFPIGVLAGPRLDQAVEDAILIAQGDAFLAELEARHEAKQPDAPKEQALAYAI